MTNLSKSIFFVLVAAFCAFAAFSQEDGELPPDLPVESPLSAVEEVAENQELTITCSGHTYNLDPHTSSYNTEAQILNGLYEGLFTYDPVTLDPLYAIAKSYRVSRDKLRWTFILNEGLKFSDGSPLTAQDVVDSWLSLLATKDAPYSSLLDVIVGAKEYRTNPASKENVGLRVVDEKTLCLTLTAPASHLPRLLCMPCFAVVKPGVYSGAFTLEQVDATQAVLLKNPNYSGAEKVRLTKITFLFNDSDEENAFNFNTGLTDWVASNIDLTKVIDKNATHIMAEFGTEYLFFKMRDNIWSNKDFREPLLEAVPYDVLRENTFVPAQTLVYPLSGYPSVTGWGDCDAVQAKLLMDDARRHVGIGDTMLKLTIAFSDTDRMHKLSDALTAAWKALDVEVNTIFIAPEEYLSKINTTDADIFCYTWIGDYSDPLAFLELFKGDSTLNVSMWKDDKYDDCIRNARRYNTQEHYNLLALAEQILLDSAVVIPIQHPVSLNVINLDAIGGWTLNAFDIHPLKYIYKRQVSKKSPDMAIFAK